MRQSKVLTRAQTRQAMTEMTASELYKAVEYPEIHTAVAKEELSSEEKARLHAWLGLVHRQYEWFAAKEGVADPAMSQAYAHIIRIGLGTERTRRWRNSQKTVQAFDPQFVSFVDELLKDAPLLDEESPLRSLF